MSELFPEAAPDFSDPLGMLRACHKRILSHCELLEKLARHLDLSGVDKDAQEAARRVHRYFSIGAVHHHADEEEDIFPKVVRSSLKMAEIVHRLKQEHAKLEQSWKDLGPMLANPKNIGDTEQFMALVDSFCEAYRQHIKLEEKDFLDRAEHMLSSEQLKAIGKSMEERRRPRKGSTEY